MDHVEVNLQMMATLCCPYLYCCCVYVLRPYKWGQYHIVPVYLLLSIVSIMLLLRSALTQPGRQLFGPRTSGLADFFSHVPRAVSYMLPLQEELIYNAQHFEIHP
jgi:hypothetical protein